MIVTARPYATEEGEASMRFRDEYWFLSNFYPSEVTLDGVTYWTAEAAFQAQKCSDPGDRLLFADEPSGRKAKLLGRRVALRPDWNEVRVDEMRRVIHAKFSDPRLAGMLVATDGEIVEDNHWHDTFWGRCDGVGENWLGRILMDERERLRAERAT